MHVISDSECILFAAQQNLEEMPQKHLHHKTEGGHCCVSGSGTVQCGEHRYNSRHKRRQVFQVVDKHHRSQKSEMFKSKEKSDCFKMYRNAVKLARPKTEERQGRGEGLSYASGES
jgi:hypothetical protein